MSSRADKKAAAAPLLRLRSRFHPLMQLYRHPVRLTVSLLLMLFLLPEAAMLGTKFAGLPVLYPMFFRALRFFAWCCCRSFAWPL
ncbi:MAG: hypothetical protein H3C49_05730 [Alphaproteobacteria bacterium]|nr:hypothetical protein [Alphaproteobacteria bacterium]